MRGESLYSDPPRQARRGDPRRGPSRPRVGWDWGLKEKAIRVWLAAWLRVWAAWLDPIWSEEPATARELMTQSVEVSTAAVKGAPTFETAMLALVDEVGRLRHEIALHQAVLPETYAYGDVMYRRTRGRQGDATVYRAV